MRDPVVKPSLCWIALGLFAYVLLPWYALQDGLLAGAWLQGLVSDPAAASALFQTGLHGKPWLGVPGVLLEFESAAGSSGQAAYLRFLDRRVPSAGLELPMLLSPGHYRLALRMRAQSLRSEMGLQWIIACAGAGGEVARIESIDGSFGWREFEADFQIPSS